MTDEIKATSLDKLTSEIRESWYEAFPMPGQEATGSMAGCSYVVEVFDAYVITCFDDHYYRVGYSLDTEGDPTFAPRQDWAEVESVQAWVDKVAEMKAAKIGSRNNAADRQCIRGIRAKAKEIIDHTMQMEPDDEDKQDAPGMTQMRPSKAEYEAGQLCPYCEADLSLPKVGWYKCGNCGKSFYAEDSDSDYEDYHAIREEKAEQFKLPQKPGKYPTAKVLRKPAKNSLKAISKTDDELRVANYIILFDKKDLEGLGSKRVNADGSIGEQFDPAVEVESDYTKTGVLYVDWEHGQDPDNVGTSEHDVLGYVDWKTATRDERGIFVQRVLNRRSKYMQWLEGLIEEGLVTNSSEAAPGVEKKSDGTITRWPLKRDALTVNPMQWQNLKENTVQALKALGVNINSFVPGSTAQQPPVAEVPPAVTVPEPVLSTTQREVKAMPEFTEEQLKAFAADAAKTAVEQYRKSAPAKETDVVVTLDEADRPFRSLHAECKAVREWEISKGGITHPRLTNPNLKAKAIQGASETVASDGGFLLEPDIAKELLTPVNDVAPFTTALTSRKTNKASGWINGVDETSRANGSRWGGVIGYRVAEGAAITGSRPKFRRVNWDLKKYAALLYATDELLTDTQFSQVARTSAGEEILFMVNDDMMNGEGAAGCTGFMKSPSLVTVSKENQQAADTIVNENLMKMWARMSTTSKRNAVWYYNTDCGPQLHALALAAGFGALEPRFVTYAPDGSLRIYGRPAVETEYNATLGDLGDLVCADFPGGYLLWEYTGGVQEASSVHVEFLTDQTVFRFTYRADGQTVRATPLTPKNGSNTTSSFVALEAR